MLYTIMCHGVASVRCSTLRNIVGLNKSENNHAYAAVLWNRRTCLEEVSRAAFSYMTRNNHLTLGIVLHKIEHWLAALPSSVDCGIQG